MDAELRELCERLRAAMTIPVTILTVQTMQEIIDTIAAQAAEWRPIETAPKDGTFVLLYSAERSPHQLIARWKRAEWWGQLTNSGRAIVWLDATHWMPLPSPPAIADSGAGGG